MGKVRRKKTWQKPSTRRRSGSVDRSLLMTTVGLILFGIVMVFSASAPYAASAYGDSMYYFKRDLAFGAIGLVIMWLVSHIDYRRYQSMAPFLFVTSLLFCLLVFIPKLGREINGARRWIFIGSFSVMPSDFLKIGSVIALSAFLARRDLRDNGTLPIFFRVMLLIGVTIAPVLLQPNFSAVMVLTVSLGLLYVVGGMRGRHFFLVLLLGALGAAIAFRPTPGNYRLERLLAVLDPTKDPLGSGWHLLQSLYAVSSGGLFGVGLGQGRQKFDYLAEEPHNDFIFAVISEELGFVGAALLLLVFVFLLYRMVSASASAKTDFGRLLGYGLSFIIGFQALVNIGVSIGMVPPTGITLPFISYGGSSLLAMCAMMGIVLNLSRDEG